MWDNSVFQVMSGSVAGSRHLAFGVNNQDAVYVNESMCGLVAVVCDGCSSAPNSEIGARLQALVLGQALTEMLLWTASVRMDEPQESHILDRLVRLETPEGLMASAQKRLIAFFQGFSRLLTEPEEQATPHMLLATALGFVMTPAKTFVFRRGDGLLVLNTLDPIVFNENNTPNYPAYDMQMGAEVQPFRIVAERPTIEVNRLLIGSDGMGRFISRADHRAHGGEPLGGIHQFFDHIYMSNPDLGQRRLMACGPYMGWKSRLLDDDTSFIRVQRRVP